MVHVIECDSAACNACDLSFTQIHIFNAGRSSCCAVWVLSDHLARSVNVDGAVFLDELPVRSVAERGSAAPRPCQAIAGCQPVIRVKDIGIHAIVYHVADSIILHAESLDAVGGWVHGELKGGHGARSAGWSFSHAVAKNIVSKR